MTQNNNMKIHFIAIGGSAMHNLAISLRIKGYEVTGSDDEIFEPAAGRLKKYNLFPENIGWNAARITPDTDAVILGMHARIDNPELLKAKELGLKIYSYPEFIYEQSKNKTRIVIGGSHGKTTITSMILHVLNSCNFPCDFMIGAQLEGFEVMTKLSDATHILIEGDEYLTSPIDRRPKFHVYQPTIGLISGIAWDHVNVFPTFDNYLEQFHIFANLIPDKGALIYCDQDIHCKTIADKATTKHKLAYTLPEFRIENGQYSILNQGKNYPLQVFGQHNLLNIEAAHSVCHYLGISNHDFYTAIQSFKGASKRLELVYEDKEKTLYKDFAHAPSKLKATIAAVKEKYPERALVACVELHTFSSLTAEFLKQYAHSMDKADLPLVYFNPHAIALKKLPLLSENTVFDAFANPKLRIFQNAQTLYDFLKSLDWKNKNLLMMSSGNFDGMKFEHFFNS
ncbi:MAG: UDP-N-acetylmuramate:L-alanyl-gamma-D-glutamyl-meso-diaminopimelate ligase [Bacteroidetes bacterium ADurb.Bin234]|nr:MAG: UDP-N-acetylmuramate:L-alanyl-gamma-D-glutamyl-meso-diaminopimelate ligase [Bacteroidetes bacterium ADurb.Bin234]